MSALNLNAAQEEVSRHAKAQRLLGAAFGLNTKLVAKIPGLTASDGLRELAGLIAHEDFDVACRARLSVMEEAEERRSPSPKTWAVLVVLLQQAADEIDRATNDARQRITV